MNKRGVTLLELIISISLISVVILLLIKVTFSLSNINGGSNYASSDEIDRAKIIKAIEEDFLSLNLRGIKIDKSEDLVISFIYDEDIKSLVINNNSLMYNDIKYMLQSDKATYDLCPKYTYTLLSDGYYIVNLTIPVLINNENTTINDDIVLSYIGLSSDNDEYLEEYVCVK